MSPTPTKTNARRPLFIIVGVVVLAVIAAIAWPLVSPLFISQTVDEPFPFDAPSAAEVAQMSDTEQQQLRDQFEAAVPNEQAMAEMPEAEAEQVESKVMEAAAVLPDSTMDEPAPTGPVALSQGQFIAIDAIHRGAGSATIFELPDSNRTLRFEDFDVTNGPDLHVLLVANPTPTGRDDMGEYIDLGKLKGNVGNQNYEIPADVDLSKYGSVLIYCMPFHVVFTYATQS